MATVRVYVALLEEGVDVWRPVDADDLGDGRYRLIAPGDFDRETERWAIAPGTVVRSESRTLGGGMVQVAVEDPR
jgi:hypothetical protein